MSDESAQAQFQTLLAQHWGIVLKVAYSYGRSAEDRDDLAQEICLQLWRSFARYDASRTFSTWMYRVALNVAISDWRKNGRNELALLPIDSDEASQVVASPAPEPDERIAALNRLIAELDPLDRALVLLYLEERSYREIAEVLGLSETNVATKLSRLKQRIRQGMVMYVTDEATNEPRLETGESSWSLMISK